ncbi:hypothetical protein SteCoe_13206 [Stentor coeruleus]|uniref:Elongator complex protein 4 n=1 Tax=Stentor coeruleus TaxID=5963 RepID=A0A1R2C8V4_9CILI|nr:hypothetical protein SteCoe_13206 [Stentor coeruleus]
MATKHRRSSSLAMRHSLVRSGIPSFDAILNGGIPVGTLLLVEESTNDIASVFTKAFLGEGAVNSDLLLLYSENHHNSYIPDIRRIGNSSLRGESTVRYETFSSNSKIREPYAIDLSTIINDCKTLVQKTLNCTEIDFYHKLWQQVKEDLHTNFDGKSDMTVSRVIIKSMFSSNWPLQSLSEIFEFLKSIKTLLRSKNAVCIITVPISAINDKLKQLLFQSSDIIILENFFAEGQNSRISIYKAPKSTRISDNSAYTLVKSLGTTILEYL